MGVTVRQKVKGRGKPWWVFVAHNGKRTSKQVGDREAADIVASAIRARIKKGDFGIDETKDAPNFKEYADSFIKGFSKTNHKASTHETYQSALETHIYPFFGSLPIDSIKRTDIKKFLTEKQQEFEVEVAGEMKRKKLAPATVRNLKAYLSCIFEQAVDDEIIESNPVSRTGKLIKKTDRTKEINPFTWEEKNTFEQTMLDHYPNYYPLFLTALRTGMRIGELIALKPGDLDFNGKLIEVRRSVVRSRITTPKSGKIRRITMSNDLSAVLQNHIIKRKKEKLKKGWKDSPEWLFYNETGGLIDINNLRKRIFHKALTKAGLRQIRIHDLRHSYATLRIAAGHNIADVSNQLGHHSIKITIDTYYHSIPGANKSEVDQLDCYNAPNCTLSAPKQEKDLAVCQLSP